MYLKVFSAVAYGILIYYALKKLCEKVEARGYEDGLRDGYKDGQRDAKVGIYCDRDKAEIKMFKNKEYKALLNVYQISEAMRKNIFPLKIIEERVYKGMGEYEGLYKLCFSDGTFICYSDYKPNNIDLLNKFVEKLSVKWEYKK